MGYPRNESNIDRVDAIAREKLRPLPEVVLGIKKRIDNLKTSHFLVDKTIQDEQEKFAIRPCVEDLPGIPEKLRKTDSVEEILGSDPEHLFMQVKTMPVESGVSNPGDRVRMGVPNIEARTKFEAVSMPRVDKLERQRSKPAIGLPVNLKSVSNTPVTSLSFFDRIYNWITALFRGL